MFEPCSQYNSKEGASGVITDTDITSIAAFANLFKLPHPIGVARHTIIRTNAEITIRLNKVDNDVITIPANEKFECDWMGISAIFVTAAATANLKVIVGR